MKILSLTATKRRLPAVLGCLTLGIILAAAHVLPAAAENDRGRGGQNNGQHNQNGRFKQNRGYNRNWNEHENNARRYWNRPYFQPAPSVVYAPPLYYPPPYYEEPGISLIFPLHIH